MYYSKLPPKIATLDSVLVVDPMLATGGSVLMAIKVTNVNCPVCRILEESTNAFISCDF